MTIAVYSDLKTAIANFMNRTDLTARIPEFIALAESRIAYGSMEAPFQCDPLRIRAMETSASTATSSQSNALPTGFLAFRRVYLNTNPIVELSMVDPDFFWRRFNSGTSQPTQYTLEGDNFLLGPAPDGSYTVKQLYWQKFAALSADGDTNWLLTNASGAYLYGALIEAYTYIRNTEEAENSHKKFVGIINTLHKSDKRDRFSAGPWVVRSQSGNP